MTDSIVANDPNSAQSSELREQAEAALKQELLKDLSLDDIRLIVNAVKSGTLENAFKRPNDAPDTYDEFGRNFRRMSHRFKNVGPSGNVFNDERPFALTLEEARASKVPCDYFDTDTEDWVWLGKKRSRDYPENTVGYMEESGALR